MATQKTTEPWGVVAFAFAVGLGFGAFGALWLRALIPPDSVPCRVTVSGKGINRGTDSPVWYVDYNLDYGSRGSRTARRAATHVEWEAVQIGQTWDSDFTRPPVSHAAPKWNTETGHE
jgi:hypothetical protein